MRQLLVVLLPAVLLALSCPSQVLADGFPALAEEYIERYFERYPTRATAAGRHDHDRELFDPSAERRGAWIAFNARAAATLRHVLADPTTAAAERLDAEALLRQAERELLSLTALRSPERNPLFWTGLLSGANVHLLVRDDLPVAERLRAAAARAGQIPAVAKAARAVLEATDPAHVAPELCEIAASQARSTASFYARGFADAVPADHPEAEALRAELRAVGLPASLALDDLAFFLGELEEKATGTPRLGELYAPLFHLVTGVDDPLEQVLARAEAALVDKRRETAEYGRGVWEQYFEEVPPEDDLELIRALFARVAEDRADSVEGFIGQYRGLIEEAARFVVENDVMTIDGPPKVRTDRSPSHFIGQSVGGVYPSGPYQPDADTLFYLPTPPDSFGEEQRDAFFRDFNDHFNRMIIPHEMAPGHYLQSRRAAQHPHKVRALYSDGVYVEGWGTFCERLMLDLGWGDPLDRLAHLKKQLENIARTIVDIRYHTRGMTRQEVLAFVQLEALQDAQFAVNMWRRTLTSAPQITTYFLGYEQIYELYEDVRAARGEEFVLREFMDGMMELGPVPVRHYRRVMLSTEREGEP